MTKKITSRQLRAMETRAKLIDAARQTIAEKGFDAASVEEITRRAGVSTGTFYTYFSRKEDIAEEFGKDDFMHLAEIVNGMEEADIFEKLAYYGMEFLKTIENGGIEICRQWIRNNAAPLTMKVNGVEITKYRHDYETVRKILEGSVQKGELTADMPIEEMALFINAGLYGLMTVWCMSDADVVGTQWIDRFCSDILRPVLMPYLSDGSDKAGN